jgi:hypothetical protein
MARYTVASEPSPAGMLGRRTGSHQWSVIDPHVEPLKIARAADGYLVVNVHRLVKNLEGQTLIGETVKHAFRLDGGHVRRFDIQSDTLLTGIHAKPTLGVTSGRGGIVRFKRLVITEHFNTFNWSATLLIASPFPSRAITRCHCGPQAKAVEAKATASIEQAPSRTARVAIIGATSLDGRIYEEGGPATTGGTGRSPRFECLDDHVTTDKPTISRPAGGRKLAPGGRLLATSENSPNPSVNVRPIPDRAIPALSRSALQLPS